MKKERIVAIPKPIINCERGGGYRPVRLILRQNTAGAAVFKEMRNVFDVPDVGIVIDGMAVVKMKAIVKVVGIHRRNSSENKNDIK